MMTIINYKQIFDSSRSTLQRLEWSAVKKALRWKFPEMREVSTETLANWLTRPEKERPLLFDTRSSEEYEVSHIQGAQRVDTIQDAQDLLQDSEKNRLIVVYCSIGYRSAVILKELQSQGFTNVYNLEGSLFTWANEGYPIYRDAEQIHIVHPYDKRWAQLLKRTLRGTDNTDGKAR